MPSPLGRRQKPPMPQRGIGDSTYNQKIMLSGYVKRKGAAHRYKTRQQPVYSTFAAVATLSRSRIPDTASRQPLHHRLRHDSPYCRRCNTTARIHRFCRTLGHCPHRRFLRTHQDPHNTGDSVWAARLPHGHIGIPGNEIALASSSPSLAHGLQPVCHIWFPVSRPVSC